MDIAIGILIALWGVTVMILLRPRDNPEYRDMRQLEKLRKALGNLEKK